MNVQIIGIGQSLRGDDAVGLRVVETWRAIYAHLYADQQVESHLLETPGLNLLDFFEPETAVILVDAMHSDAMPGSIRFLVVDDLSSFTSDAASAHGWGLAETLMLSNKVMPDSIPTSLSILSIEIEQLDIGTSLSSAVTKAIPQAAKILDDQIKALLDS